MSSTFQSRFHGWVETSFGERIAKYMAVERHYRFLEKDLELVQSLICTHKLAHLLVGYVYGRNARCSSPRGRRRHGYIGSSL